MQTFCDTCGQPYDDAVCWTFCPHKRFITDEVAARKDRAMRLLGKAIYWNTDTAKAEPLRVEAVSMDGMVEVSGFSGRFAPSLFQTD